MKKYIIPCLLYLTAILSYAGQPLKMGIISDTHYLSEQLMDDSYATENYIYTSARDIKNVPVLLDSVFSDYLKSGIQILLISGDITKDGEKQSHIDFVKKLKPLQEKGIQVFVVPGNHDINTKAKRFVGNKTFDAENVSPEEFAEIYNNCGYSAALKRDPASLSYLAPLNDDTWLLAIDVARKEEFRKTGLPSEIISGQTEKWILEILEEARQKQKQVIGMMHWGLVEHLPYQSEVFPKYLIYDWKRLANLFADNGMRAIFTGHFHSNDISAFDSDAGNRIYDIETGPLCCYPFAYRFAELTDSGISISTKKIESLPQSPKLALQNKALLKQLTEKIAMQRLKSSGFITDGNISTELVGIISEIFLIHVAGDENLNEGLKEQLKQLTRLLDSPEEENAEIPELDFFPADNNVYIEF